MPYIETLFTTTNKNDFPRMKDFDYSVTTSDSLQLMIRYFDWLPTTQKRDVAQAIAAEIKRRHLKITIGRKHPILSHLSTKLFYVSDREPSEQYADVTRMIGDLFRLVLDNLTFPAVTTRLITDIRKIIFAKDECIITRYYNAWTTWNQILTSAHPKDLYTQPTLNIVHVVNEAFFFMRRELVQFMRFNRHDAEGALAQEHLLWDVMSHISESIHNGFNPNSEVLQSLRVLSNATTITVIIGHIRSLQLTMYNHLKNPDEDCPFSEAMLHDIIDRLETEVLECSGYFRQQFDADEATKLIDYLYESVSLPNTNRFLEEQKIKQEFELDIMYSYEMNTAPQRYKSKHLEVFQYDLIERIQAVDLSLQFPNKHVSAITVLDDVTRMELNRFEINPDDLTMFRGVYFIRYYDRFGILVRNKDDIGVLQLLTESGEPTRTLKALCQGLTLWSEGTVYFIARSSSASDKPVSVPLTEGISFDADGNMKFSFTPTATLMDQYSTNHTMLVSNIKAENWDAAKSNLAVAFHLVNETEKILHSKKRKNEDIRKDATRARAFAMNDFKTYLPVITREDRAFNFSKYFEESELGKITFGVTPHDIAGVRKLLRLIIVG